MIFYINRLLSFFLLLTSHFDKIFTGMSIDIFVSSPIQKTAEQPLTYNFDNLAR
jgi:hypothetical protein